MKKSIIFALVIMSYQRTQCMKQVQSQDSVSSQFTTIQLSQDDQLPLNVSPSSSSSSDEKKDNANPVKVSRLNITPQLDNSSDEELFLMTRSIKATSQEIHIDIENTTKITEKLNTISSLNHYELKTWEDIMVNLTTDHLAKLKPDIRIKCIINMLIGLKDGSIPEPCSPLQKLHLVESNRKVKYPDIFKKIALDSNVISDAINAHDASRNNKKTISGNFSDSE